jgi:hypothetical protein
MLHLAAGAGQRVQDILDAHTPPATALHATLHNRGGFHRGAGAGGTSSVGAGGRVAILLLLKGTLQERSSTHDAGCVGMSLPP